MTEHIEYQGRDLEAMSFAPNYHKWILDEFRPFLGKRLVEVGAGIGFFSRLLLKEDLETLTMVEPSGMFAKLKKNVSGVESRVKLNMEQSRFAPVSKLILERDEPDSIIYVNVLEHIEDDLEELKTVYETLSGGGRCFIFVPALMALYGRYDASVGHFRRYSKPGLEGICEKAGFKILMSKYFDLAGVSPWWVKHKMMGSVSLSRSAVTIYDKFVVPATRLMERAWSPPIGKNILIIAEKTAV